MEVLKDCQLGVFKGSNVIKFIYKSNFNRRKFIEIWRNAHKNSSYLYDNPAAKKERCIII